MIGTDPEYLVGGDSSVHPQPDISVMELPSLDDMHDEIADVDVLRKECAKWRAKYAVALAQMDQAYRRIDELQETLKALDE